MSPLFEQRVHRVAHDIDGTVALGQVGDMDEIDGPRLRVIGEERHQARRPFYGVEGDALQRQRVVRAVHVGGQIGFGIEHFPFSAVEPVRIDIQFLNQDVLVPGRAPPCPFRSSKGRPFRCLIVELTALVSVLLFFSIVLSDPPSYRIKIFYGKYFDSLVLNSKIELIFVLQS